MTRAGRPTHPLRLAAAAAALLAACGGPVSRPHTVDTVPDGPVETIDMEPIVLEHRPGEDGPVVEAFEAASLFQSAKDAFDSQRFDDSERLYGKLLELFPESQYAAAAIYNRGLALEHLGQHGQAAAHFRRYTQLARTLKDQRDGEFRWGYNLVRTGDYPSALDLYGRLLLATDLNPADRGEAYLRRATALSQLGRYGEAERDIRMSLENVGLAYEGFVRGNEVAAEAHFRRGEIYQRLCRSVALALPLEKMKTDLSEKVKFFRQSQASFIDALNVAHVYWATASGLKLGELYEDFYTDVLNAEIPPDFDRETRRHYVLELRKQLIPVLEQSLAIYEKNITMSQRVGAENEWVRETEARVDRLRSLIEAGQRGVAPEGEAEAAATGAPP